MDKYLLEILKEVNTIIIPGLGAMTLTDKSTGEIMFMSYLKHDDGALSKHISEKEGMDENDAKNLISKYVREILSKLDQGESYDMFQFGSFYKDGDDVNFKNWEKAEMNEDVEVENIPAAVVEKPKVEEPKEEIKVEPKEKEKPITVREEEPVEASSAAMNIAQKEELDANTQKLEKLKENKRAEKEKSKRGLGFWLLIVLVVLIVGGGTTIGIFYEDVKQHIPFLADNSSESESEKSELEKMEELLIGDETEELEESEPFIEDSTEVSEEEITEKETITEEEIISEETPKEQPVTYSSKGSYHVIAGAFGSLENAERLAAKFREQGYSVRVGEGRGMNLVSIKSFSSKSEAEAGAKELKDVAPNAWVFKWD